MNTNLHPLLGDQNQLLQADALAPASLLGKQAAPPLSSGALDVTGLLSSPIDPVKLNLWNGAVIPLSAAPIQIGQTQAGQLYGSEDGLLVGQLQSNDSLIQPNWNTLSTKAQEIVFVDSGVEDYQQIIAGLNPSAKVVVLEQDGVAQISEVLNQQQNVGTIHIISHGNSAGLRLGTTLLTSSNLGQFAEQIRGWSSALTLTADILLYGCDVAATETGRQFVQQLSDLTGADVAASDDLTGAASLGGNWQLEYRQGEIEATAITSQYDDVLLSELTLKDIYTAWQARTLPSFDTVEIKLDNTSIVQGTLTIDRNDASVLRLVGANLTGFVGKGLGTSTTGDDAGLNFANTNLELSLNADGSLYVEE